MGMFHKFVAWEVDEKGNLYPAQNVANTEFEGVKISSEEVIVHFLSHQQWSKHTGIVII